MKETVAQEEKEEVGIYTPFPFPLKKCCVLKKNLHDLDNEENLGKIQIKWTFDEVTENNLTIFVMQVMPYMRLFGQFSNLKKNLSN